MKKQKIGIILVMASFILLTVRMGTCCDIDATLKIFNGAFYVIPDALKNRPIFAKDTDKSLYFTLFFSDDILDEQTAEDLARGVIRQPYGQGYNSSTFIEIKNISGMEEWSNKLSKMDAFSVAAELPNIVTALKRARNMHIADYEKFLTEKNSVKIGFVEQERDPEPCNFFSSINNKHYHLTEKVFGSEILPWTHEEQKFFWYILETSFGKGWNYQYGWVTMLNIPINLDDARIIFKEENNYCIAHRLNVVMKPGILSHVKNDDPYNFQNIEIVSVEKLFYKIKEPQKVEYHFVPRGIVDDQPSYRATLTPTPKHTFNVDFQRLAP